MKIKLLAEALYLFNRLENLMRERGGNGKSFSDLVKSFNPLETEEKKKDLKSCQEFIKHIDSSDYLGPYDKVRYDQCKKTIKEFYEKQELLMDGMYPTLKEIGHQRNQLLHIYNYKIDDFSRFKKACLQMINYFEKGVLPKKNKRVYLKEPKKFKEHSLNSKYFSSNSSFSNLWIWIPSFILFILFPFLTFYLFMEYTIIFKWIFYTFIFTLLALALFKVLIKYITWIIWAGIFAGVIYISPSVTKKHINARRGADHVSRYSTLSRKHDSARRDTLSLCQNYYVNVRTLNIRSNPKRSAHRIGLLHRNEKVCVTRKKGHWYHLRSKGWVFGDYLSLKLSYTSRNKHKNYTDKRSKKSHINNNSRQQPIYHCIAKGKRASGWAEKAGISQAKKEALHQCNIRRVEAIPCRITMCYPLH